MVREEYKQKFLELTPTGNIPPNPTYLYEYELPDDLEEVKYLQSYKQIVRDYSVYLNNKNQFVIACNEAPVILCYRPTGV